jgi:transcriptional regulator with GAF, ATPase, and Fis domain
VANLAHTHVKELPTVELERQMSRRTTTPKEKLEHGQSIDVKLEMKRMEKELVLTALDRAQWVTSRAARMLNLHPHTFYMRLRRLGITLP